VKLRIVSILCPKCGAAVNFHEEDRVIKCQHCNTNFIPVHRKGIEAYYFKPQIKRPEVKIDSFLRNKGFSKKEYKILDTDRFFVPKWRATGHVTGWVAGLSPLKTVKYSDNATAPNGRTVTVTRTRQEGGLPLKKLLKIEKQVSRDAIRFPDIRLNVEEVTKPEYSPFLRLFDEQEMSKWGKILTPDTPPSIKKRNVKNAFIKSSIALYIDYNPFVHRLKVIGERIFLYYFPVTLFKIKLGNEIISLTVNELSGKLTSNKLVKAVEEPKKKFPLLLRTFIVLLASLFSTSLVKIGTSIANQIAIMVVIIAIIFIWIEK